MADPVITAQRRADAMAEFQRQCKVLASNLDIEPPQQPMPIAKDPALREVQDLQSMVAFVGAVNDKLGFTEAKEPPPPPAAEPEPGTPDAEPDNPPEEDEPTFHGRPLSFFDDYATEDDLVAIDGVGRATARKILDARRDRDGK